MRCHGQGPGAVLAFDRLPTGEPDIVPILVEQGQDCKYVYAEAADGFKRLIYDKYVDPKLLNEIKDVDWYAPP